MRSAPKSDQEKVEIEAAERTDRRKGAFQYMGVRDQGWADLRDYNGNKVTMHWHIDAPLKEYEARRFVPDGQFTLDFKGQTVAFDAEEFRRFLRWA